MNPITRRSLHRSRKDRMFLGVCGGLAETFNLDPTIVRLLSVLIMLSSMGSGLAIYLVLALVMPLTPADGAANAAAAPAQQPEPGALTDSGAVVAVPKAASDAAFTAEEIARWDLPGEVVARAPDEAASAAARETGAPAGG